MYDYNWKIFKILFKFFYGNNLKLIKRCVFWKIICLCKSIVIDKIIFWIVMMIFRYI